MRSLIYVSSATVEFSEADLLKLLQDSVNNNASLGITGMLLYKGGNFIQVLEGPGDVVRELFLKIRKDGRHQGVIQLLDREVEEREFPDWSMGFRNLNDPAVRDIPGYSEFLNEPLNSEKFRGDMDHARRLLSLFRRNMGR